MRLERPPCRCHHCWPQQGPAPFPPIVQTTAMPPRSARDLRRSLEAVLSLLERLRSPLGLEDSRRVADAMKGLLTVAEAPLTGDLAALAK